MSADTTLLEGTAMNADMNEISHVLAQNKQESVKIEESNTKKQNKVHIRTYHTQRSGKRFLYAVILNVRE